MQMSPLEMRLKECLINPGFIVGNLQGMPKWRVLKDCDILHGFPFKKGLAESFFFHFRFFIKTTALRHIRLVARRWLLFLFDFAVS